MVMPSIDDFFSKLAKKQKYLLVRIVVISLLLAFGLYGTYSTPDVNMTLFLNTLLLFFLPLFMEYLLGLDTHNNLTIIFRWLGFLVTLFFCGLCVVGYMGGVELVKDEQHMMLTGLLVFKTLPISLPFIKVLSISSVFVAIGDFVFTLSPREIYFYKLNDDISAYIRKELEKAKDDRLKAIKVKIKQDFRDALHEVKLDGGAPK